MKTNSSLVPSSIEPLEARIAPAVLVNPANPKLATYTDVDGDLVTITVSAGDLNLATFTTAAAGTLGGEQLKTFDFNADAGFSGVSLTITAKPQNGNGDGLVNIGRIDGNGLDLGSVKIRGDLGQLPAVNIKSLSVISLGRFDASTGAPNLAVFLTGRLGALKVQGDIVQVHVFADSIGPVTVGGSVIGGFFDDSGSIDATHDIGPVKIGGDLVGGDGRKSGAVFSNLGNIASVSIGGSLIGRSTIGGNVNSGIIFAEFSIGAVTIGGDIRGGDGDFSGEILSENRIASVTLRGSLVGGEGGSSGLIISSGDIGPVKITGNVRGGAGSLSGRVSSNAGHLDSVTIDGSLIGAAGSNSGTISFADGMGPVKILGDLIGGTTIGAGAIRGGVESVTIGGSVIGGSAPNTGEIAANPADIGPVKIGRDLRGGSGTSSGRIFTGGKLGDVTIGGSLTGGTGIYNIPGEQGQIVSGGDMGVVKIGRDIIGGTMGFSAIIFSSGALAGATVGGSMLAGPSLSASIFSHGAMGPVKIAGDVVGTISGGQISADQSTLASVTIGGSLLAGTGFDTGKIFSFGAMGPVKIGGSVIGNGGRSGQISSFASIGSVTIGGDLVGGASDESGYMFAVTTIGKVSIGGSIVGGAGLRTGTVFGQSGIAGVRIGGSLLGGAGSVSGALLSGGSIGPVKIGGDFEGGDVHGSASSDSSGSIQGTRLASLFVGGSIRAGVDDSSGTLMRSGAVRFSDDIGPITIKGSILGSKSTDGSGGFTLAVVSARGQPGLSATATTDLAIKRLAIGGRVERAQILAGYDTLAIGRNADAQIGPVVIGGDLIASSIIAGVGTALASFGTASDGKITGGKDSSDALGAISKIASVIIKGSALGTFASNDAATFGIEAQQIGSIKLGGATVALATGAGNDLFAKRHPLGPTLAAGSVFDFHAFEVALT
jgi:hypothetical protein